MYKTIVRRKTRDVFDKLSRGEWRETLGDIHPDVHHVFPGDNAVGGERHSRAAMERWFERVFRLFPTLQFDVKQVNVRGWPWDTRVSVEWADHTTPAEGEPYVNEGAHWIRMRWGKAVYIHAYLDTEKVTDACESLAAAGIDEARAAPIID